MSETTQRLLPSPDPDQFEGDIADLGRDQKNSIGDASITLSELPLVMCIIEG